MEELTEREREDERLITEAFDKLLDIYMNSNHRKNKEVIIKAFNFAKQAHKGVRRLSGEPYILHPIAVARIVCEEIGMGSTSICAALLHDVEEDTDYTNEDIKNLFGPKVANIVEGLTKISGGIFGDRASLQAETFKKLLLTLSDDFRVILIKMSDRLHNMRTLSSMPPNKQYKIAGETLYIYAPLADRLGLNRIKNELEDLSFLYEHPKEYHEIEQRLADTKGARDTVFDEFTPPIREALDKMGFQYQIKARVKTPYSIWKKMQTKHVAFDEIYDILAIRIVFTPLKQDEEINECFNIYVALTHIYRSHPDRLRDWLSHPKANGYQALHVTLMSKKGEWIEVQIRSDRMDVLAERGDASHWLYKDPEAARDLTTNKNSKNDEQINKWISTIREILDDPQPDTIDFLDTIKLNLFASEILVFTPKGEIKTMPAGSTVLDFAFSIHSFLGGHCIGAKVNHKLEPVQYQLKSGDQVEVLTAKELRVERRWVDFATTAKAKCKIQAILRHEDRERQGQGEDILRRFLEPFEVEMSSVVIDKLCSFHGVRNRDELFLAIGTHQIILGGDDIAYLQNKSKRKRNWRRYIPFMGAKTKQQVDEALQQQNSQPSLLSTIDRKKVFYITDENIDSCTFSPCCNPIPNDEVLGYMDNENDKFVIHKRNCERASTLKSTQGNRLVAVEWGDIHNKYFKATIQVEGVDEEGTLCNITEVIYRKFHFNVIRLLIESDNGIFKGIIDMNVHNDEEVKQICKALKVIENVVSAFRIDIDSTKEKK